MKTFYILFALLTCLISSSYFSQSNPSTSLVESSLIKEWKKSGYNKSLLPNTIECKPIYYCKGVKTALSPYLNGYLVDIVKLNDDINATSEQKLSVIYFPAGDYYFDKSATINLSKQKIVLSGAGASKTKFHIIAKTTSSSVAASDFINFQKDFCGVTCLSIETFKAFPSSYYKKRNKHEKFRGKSIFNISSRKNCWVENVKVWRGYGCTAIINSGSNNSILGCDFSGQWTIGGSGGTQGYGILINNSDYNLIENNKVGWARHAIVVQGGADNSTSENSLSSFNVISYNHLYRSKASWPGGLTKYSYDFTLHGVGKNKKNLIEGNLCERKMSVDDDHGSNGSDNTFYRNISKTRIEVKKKSNCSGNAGQKFILNKVFKNGIIDRWGISAKNHLLRGNSKCNSSGGSCSTGSFTAGSCSFSRNRNTSLTSGKGVTCYLVGTPDFMSSLPVFNGTNNNPASARSSVSSNTANCYSCRLPLCATTTEPLPNDKRNNRSSDNEAETNVVIEKALTIKDVEMKIYPNPFQISSTLEINTQEEGMHNITIYSIKGDVIMNKNISLINGINNISLKGDDYKKGMYFVSLRINDKLKTIKFIVK